MGAHDLIKQLIADHFDIFEENVQPGKNLADDLGADSLDCIEIVMMLEEHFNIEISDDEAEKCHLVQDIYDLIDKKTGKVT